MLAEQDRGLVQKVALTVDQPHLGAHLALSGAAAGGEGDHLAGVVPGDGRSHRFGQGPDVGEGPSAQDEGLGLVGDDTVAHLDADAGQLGDLDPLAAVKGALVDGNAVVKWT